MTRSLLLITILCITATTALPQKKKSKGLVNFSIQPLAPGIWGAIQNDQYGRAICNAGIVDLGDKTLVFDPFMTPEAAQELKQTAESLTGKPVTLVINSHYHSDHIRGNQVFVPYAHIISTNYTRKAIAKSEPDEQQWEREHVAGLLKATRKIFYSSNGIEREELPLWIGYYEGMMESLDDLKISLPDIVFNDSLWIMGTDRDVELVEFKNCHTASDVVLFIPSAKVAFLGDILFVDRHPWISDGDPANWQVTLQNLYTDVNFSKYLPGHGPICGKEGLKNLSDYFTALQKLAKSADNDSLQSRLLNQPMPGVYQKWYFRRFYEPNMKCLFGINNKQSALRGSK